MVFFFSALWSSLWISMCWKALVPTLGAMCLFTIYAEDFKWDLLRPYGPLWSPYRALMGPHMATKGEMSGRGRGKLRRLERRCKLSHILWYLWYLPHGLERRWERRCKPSPSCNHFSVPAFMQPFLHTSPSCNHFSVPEQSKVRNSTATPKERQE